MKKQILLINIWDDYYDDGFIPKGKKQKTYMYVYSDINYKGLKLVLDYNCLNFVLDYMNNTLNLKGIKMYLFFYDSLKEHPSLKGTEYEKYSFKRWQINIENLTHKRREKLVNELNKAKIKLIFSNISLKFISES